MANVPIDHLTAPQKVLLLGYPVAKIDTDTQRQSISHLTADKKSRHVPLHF